MTMTDPIADMLTRIRNAQMARHKNVNVSYSNINKGILEIMKREGYIGDFKIQDNEGKKINIILKYDKFGDPVIHSIERVSKPGLRRYITNREIKPIMGGMGIAIISTNKGLFTDKQAKRENVGGEIICKIW